MYVHTEETSTAKHFEQFLKREEEKYSITVSSAIVYFLQYFTGMKNPQKFKSQNILKLFSKLFTNCYIYRI